MSRTTERKTWADRRAVPTGIWGERIDGVHIVEANRATGWEYRPADIQILIDIMWKNYKSKGVPAVVFGIHEGSSVKYALFVRDGFLRYVPEDEDFSKKRNKRNGVKSKAKHEV